jgi:bifunctional N-acetylglucosamine-1-phosphate-uridyltransferase/glucosamine-1-phosphate-acetyltransferase GlmU-like protein
MTLVVMAAGMGSRYGGLKQMDPIGPNGEFILDYTLFDAVKAGFKKVIFVIKEENLEAFKETVSNRIEARKDLPLEVAYAFQDLNDMPAGFSVPEGRAKQWGTGHAVMAARQVIGDNDEGIAVVNADDLYGEETFEILYKFLSDKEDPACGCMAGFVLKNTLTENGSVARGVCVCTEDGYLASITERTKIAKQEGGGAAYLEDDVWHPVSEDSIVSMNAWALKGGFLASAAEDFVDFLENLKDPMKQEYYLPTAVWNFSKKCGRPLKVVKTGSKWYGVTYKEDKETVEKYIASRIEAGVYPGKGQ